MSILFIDGTIRTPNQSRTFQLASAFLDAFVPSHGGVLHHLNLKEEHLPPLTASDTEQREEIVANREDTHPLAKYAIQFSQADHIVIAAPYWDLSFPALLKIYLEYVCTCGITFAYGEQGAIPLCRAKSLTYITTSGGEIYETANMGYDYIAMLSRAMFGISNVRCLTAQNLDIHGVDIDAIMADAKSRAQALAAE